MERRIRIVVIIGLVVALCYCFFLPRRASSALALAARPTHGGGRPRPTHGSPAHTHTSRPSGYAGSHGLPPSGSFAGGGHGGMRGS
jgi:hypothetical protein